MNRIRFVAIAFTAFALYLSQCVQARESLAQAKAHALMQQFVQKSGAPGLAVSVGLHGKIYWHAGYGFADLEQRVLVTPNQSKFRVGSTVKPMTMLAIARLMEAGKIDIDAPIQTYVPSFPKKDAPISIRQLSGHLAGIRHYNGHDEIYVTQHYDTVLAGLQIFQNDPLLSKPGSEFRYSSYGYNLISAAIEPAAGQDYLSYMQTQVFAPLGMHNTVPDFVDKLIPHRGGYYVKVGNEIRNEPSVNNSYKWASGGYLSTTDDLARFGLAHIKPTLIKPETLKLLWTAQQPSSGSSDYGMGWRITQDAKGTQWIGHGGGSVGGTTQLWLQPDKGIVIAMVSNLTELNYESVLMDLAEVFSAE